MLGYLVFQVLVPPFIADPGHRSGKETFRCAVTPAYGMTEVHGAVGACDLQRIGAVCVLTIPGAPNGQKWPKAGPMYLYVCLQKQTHTHTHIYIYMYIHIHIQRLIQMHTLGRKVSSFYVLEPYW